MRERALEGGRGGESPRCPRPHLRRGARSRAFSGRKATVSQSPYHLRAAGRPVVTLVCPLGLLSPH